MKKIDQALITASKKSAIKQTGLLCMLWFHQPKVPAKLLTLKNVK